MNEMALTDRDLSNRRASGQKKCEIVELMGELLKDDHGEI